MKTIYMDVTTLLRFPAMTGIQRVVSEVAIRMIANQESWGCKVVLLHHDRDFHFSVCDKSKFLAYFSMSEGSKMDCVTRSGITIDQLEPSAFWIDLDGVWVNMLPRHLLYPQLAKRNIQIGVYVYDIIAISDPTYTSTENYIRFPPYMGAVYDYANYIFTETQYTLDQIRSLAEELGCTRSIQYRIAEPGGNFRSGEIIMDKVDEMAQRIVKNGKFLLTVSTLEVRKNHKALLDAFDAGLCEMGYQMVFVGKVGWKIDELIQRIKFHPENEKKLFHLQGIDDNTLRYLYKNAAFVLFPSYIEGYGLATVEALQYGVPPILSDVPVMREVGGEYCDYFDPDTPSELVEIIQKYEAEPELYAAKRESLKTYVPPSWDDCAAVIAKGIMEFRQTPKQQHKIEQMVYLSAREDAMLHTLEYVDHLMPFIKKILLLCPDGMAERIMQQYSGRLAITCITDSDLLNGNPLPEDHTHRNFFLRCLAMRRTEVDAEFIMSDDDYRPLGKVDQEFFIREGRYQAFYFYDLDYWPDNIRVATSYDLSMMRTNRFLKENAFPNLQYASHMPQVICKKWYLDMLEEFPGLEETGCCEWSTYFNYSIKNHPEYFDVRPYAVVAWPEMISSWQPMVTPSEYAFENFYDFLYEEGRMFVGMSTTYQPSGCLEGAKKVIINEKMMAKAETVKHHWRVFENWCNTTWKQFPSFVLCWEEGQPPELRNPPQFLRLLNASTYGFSVILIRKDAGGKWSLCNEDIRIGACWDGERPFMSQNINGRGQVVIRFTTPAGGKHANLKMYYAYGDETESLLYTLPVQLDPEGLWTQPKGKSGALGPAVGGQPDFAMLAAPRKYINRNFMVPYYRELGPAGLKTLVKRAVRKVIKCIVMPIQDMQNHFNQGVVQCINQFYIITRKNSSDTALCRQELRVLQARIQEQGRQLGEIMQTQEMQVQQARAELKELCTQINTMRGISQGYLKMPSKLPEDFDSDLDAES